MKNNYLAGFLFVLAGVLLLVWSIDGKVSFFQWSTGERELLENRQFGQSFEQLDIEASSTDVTFKRSDDNALHVNVYGYASQQDDYRLEVDEQGDTLRVVYEKNSTFSLFAFNRGHRLEISLPDRAIRSLDVHSSSGHIRSETHIEADQVRMKASSGDVILGTIHATLLEVTTSSGDVLADADLEAGEIVWKSSSGDMAMRTVRTGTLALETNSGDADAEFITADLLTVDGSSGDMDVAECACSQLKVDLSSGDVEIDALTGTVDIDVQSGEVELRNWDVSSDSSIKASSGDVQIRLRDQHQALELDLRASSGDKQVVLPDFTMMSSDKQRLTGQIGSGGPKLVVQTSSGDIDVK